MKMYSIQIPEGFLDKFNEEMKILNACISGVVLGGTTEAGSSGDICWGLSLQRYKVNDIFNQLYEHKFEDFEEE